MTTFDNISVKLQLWRQQKKKLQQHENVIKVIRLDSSTWTCDEYASQMFNVAYYFNSLSSFVHCFSDLRRSLFGKSREEFYSLVNFSHVKYVGCDECQRDGCNVRQRIFFSCDRETILLTGTNNKFIFLQHTKNEKNFERRKKSQKFSFMLSSILEFVRMRYNFSRRWFFLSASPPPGRRIRNDDLNDNKLCRRFVAEYKYHL